MGIIAWLNANSGAIIWIATVILVSIIMRRQQRIRNHPKEEMKQMTVTVYSYPNNDLSLKVHDSVEDTSFGKKSKLSLEERMALLDEIADMAMKFAGPDPQPLSDYAMSREGIYEDHP